MMRQESGTFWEYPEGRNDFIKSAVPYSVDSDELFQIVLEEADSYFFADKDVEEVTEAVQNRVQLYFDERK